MSMYLKQIEQLVALQHIDNEIIALRGELEQAPKEVEALQARYEDFVQKRAQHEEKTDYLTSQEKRLEGEIEDDRMKVKKSKNKLMMVGNTREYHAMMREMDNLEKVNRLREEERAALLEELARQDEAMKALDEELMAVKAELDVKSESLNSRVAEAEKRLNDMDSQRKASCGHVPGPILGRYEFIRSRLSHPVIVPVEKGICSGCNIAIPPQSFIELQKGQQILSCPNCQRLIYWCEHFVDEEECKNKEEAKAAALAENVGEEVAASEV